MPRRATELMGKGAGGAPADLVACHEEIRQVTLSLTCYLTFSLPARCFVEYFTADFVTICNSCLWCLVRCFTPGAPLSFVGVLSAARCVVNIGEQVRLSDDILPSATERLPACLPFWADRLAHCQPAYGAPLPLIDLLSYCSDRSRSGDKMSRRDCGYFQAPFWVALLPWNSSIYGRDLGSGISRKASISRCSVDALASVYTWERNY